MRGYWKDRTIGEDALLWANAIVLGLTAVNLALQIRDFRRRPNAPPPSRLIRWSVTGSVAGAVALIWFGFWLGTRHPG